jgi:signal transduction histidine kinase
MIASIIDGLRRAGFVLIIGGLAGLAVHAAGTGTIWVHTWSPVVIGNSILIGVLYVALLDGTVQLVRPLMEAFVPLASDRDVLVHALAPAGSVLVVFAGLTAGLRAALGAAFAPPWALLAGLGALATLGVGGVSGVLALRTSYRLDHQDHAEGWEARMRRLRTRTCPPIVMDTLAAAQSLIDEAPQQARPLLDHVQALLRYRQAAATDELVPLADELEAALWYVELAQTQYGDNLEVGFDVPDALLSVPVPRLCLLPLLENAVEHGAARSDEPCTITVTGRHDNAQLCLAVLDTGPGFDTTEPTTVLRRGSGIADLYARLREHYGPAADLSLLPQGVLWCAPIGQQAADGPPPTEAAQSMPSPEPPSE